jgi:hypothetical protein
MRGSGIAALGATTACRTDASDQDRVASAFITAALRLAPVAPVAPTELPISRHYQGRHRRRVADRLDFSCQAARP